MNKKTTYSIVTFFIVSLFLSVLIQSVMLVNYVVNQEKYTEEFCENKLTPNSNCHGSCHLTEQLQFNKADLNNRLEEGLNIVLSIFSFQQIKEIDLYINILKEKESFFSFKSCVNNFYITSIFKPPCFSRS